MYVVIGSGPAGISCAEALLDAGCSDIVLLDAGLKLEAEREQARAELAPLSRNELLAADLSRIASRLPKEKNAVKLSYGSDFPYRSIPSGETVRPTTSALRGSHALGGLSNVWGGAMLPYRQQDIEDWPIRAVDLETPYRRVLSRIPLAAEVDALAALFPLFSDDHTAAPRSRQATTLFEQLRRHRPALEAAKIQFGASRLALDVGGRTQHGLGCIACGRCLHGCPRQLIHTGRQRLLDLERRGARYRPGYVVHDIQEKGPQVAIHARSAQGAHETVEGDRVFLAAGPLYSTAIMLRSLRLYGIPTELLDSQYYLFPLLQWRSSGQVTKEALHTLSQLFIEIDDPDVTPNTVHLQVYGYNDFLAELLRDKLGPLAPLFPTTAVLGRLLLVQGYIHSNVSGRIAATLKRSNGADVLELAPRLNAATQPTVQRILRKMTRLATLTRALPVSPMLDLTDPGRGFHVGGSFPMAADPDPLQTDRLGRPMRFRRLHLVDSSVFPSIPATTITLTVMANAYRIGLEAASLDAGQA